MNSENSDAASNALNLPADAPDEIPIRESAIVAAELVACAWDVQSTVDQLERSYTITQHLMDLEFTI